MGTLRMLGFALVAWTAGCFAPATPGEAADHAQASACHHCHEDPHDGAGGTACEGCHATDRWDPSTFTVAQHTVFPLEGEHAAVACQSCHTDHRLTGLPRECSGCHLDPHRGKLGGACEQCHTTAGFSPVDGFDHALTGFVVEGAHGALACAACHEGEHGRAMTLDPTVDCATCHTPTHGDFRALTAAHADPAESDPAVTEASAPHDGGRPCEDCHTETQGFELARFDHRTTGFELHRRHAAQPCGACHAPGAPAPLARCQSCHVDPHAGQLGQVCEDCHREDRWSLARFDHDRAGWALRGRHFVTPCAECHTSQRWIGLTTTCWDCHAMDAAAAPKSVPAHGLARSDCGDCHNAWSFR